MSWSSKHYLSAIGHTFQGMLKRGQVLNHSSCLEVLPDWSIVLLWQKTVWGCRLNVFSVKLIETKSSEFYKTCTTHCSANPYSDQHSEHRISHGDKWALLPQLCRNKSLPMKRTETLSRETHALFLNNLTKQGREYLKERHVKLNTYPTLHLLALASNWEIFGNILTSNIITSNCIFTWTCACGALDFSYQNVNRLKWHL